VASIFYPATTSTTTASSTWTQWVNSYLINDAAITRTTISSTTAGTGSWTAASNATWKQWVDVGYMSGERVRYVWQDEIWGRWEADERTEEERRREWDELQARREQQSRERLARQQEEMTNRALAQERSMELLNAVVAEEDRIPGLDLLLQLRGSDGDLYRLEMHRETVHGNIVRVDEHGCMLGRACVAPAMYTAGEGALPTPDGWVGQYLGLKFDTAEFLRHANWSSVRPCQHPQEQVAA
jgi:hypothetical protein